MNQLPFCAYTSRDSDLDKLLNSRCTIFESPALRHGVGVFQQLNMLKCFFILLMAFKSEDVFYFRYFVFYKSVFQT